jgi:signal transduction histidine kinase
LENQHLATLNKIGEEVNQSLDLDVVLNRAIDRVLELMNLQAGGVRLLENGQLVLRSTRQVSDQFVNSDRSVPLGQCLCGKAVQSGEIIALEDLGRNFNFTKTACACEQFQSVLSVPVRTAERVVGVIHVASQERRVFTSNERALLMAVGHQVGIAIEKARLHEQLKALNQQLEQRVIGRTRELVDAKEELMRKADALQQVLIEERRIEEKTRARIAHDLHDSVQQLIIGALFETQAARDSLTTHPENAGQRLVAAQLLLRRIETEMRGAIYSLRPVALDAHGLVPALREYATSFSRHSGIECDVSVEGLPRRFNPDGEVAVFRIVQEALHNVESHADAQHVQLHLVWGVRDLHAEILDNGCGFDFEQVTCKPQAHLGLFGMQERAEGVGGTLQVITGIGEGTRISLKVPVN